MKQQQQEPEKNKNMIILALNDSDLKKLNESVTPLKDVELTILGKIFFASAANFIINGKKSNIKLKGTPAQVEAVAKALLSSRNLFNELKSSGASIETIVEKLKIKSEDKKRFEELFGVSWDL